MEPAVCASSIAPIVGDLGARFMLHPETMAAGERAGQPNGFSFYMAGRGGVLGDVDADVVYSAFMFFNPAIVAKMWNVGIAVAGASAAAASYAEACAQWGRTRLADLDGVGRLADLLARINSGADSAGLSLFAGWRAVPLPDDDPGRAYQSIHVLRELRGSIHVAAAVAVGLTGLDAVLVGDDGGEAIAKLHGWPDATLDPERAPALRAKWERAEADTTARMSDLLARTLDGPERSELVALLTGAAAAIAARP